MQQRIESRLQSTTCPEALKSEIRSLWGMLYDLRDSAHDLIRCMTAKYLHQKEDLNRRLQIADERIDKLQGLNEELYEHYQAEVQELQWEIEHLERETACLLTENERLRTENRRLKAKVKHLRKLRFRSWVRWIPI
jgi:ABC-type phosphate transport system auxiliary subunit